MTSHSTLPADSKPTAIASTGQLRSHPIHRSIVTIAVLCYVWFLAFAWLFFDRDGRIGFDLAVASVVSMMLFTLLLGGALRAKDEPADHETLPAFLDGDVETFTGPMKGRMAAWEILAMPVALAVGTTLLGLVLALAG